MYSALPPNAPTGKPPPIDLASVTRSGVTPSLLRGAAVAGGDAGLDLVEDQERAVPVADLTNRLEVPRLGQTDPDVLHHRLDDEAGDLAALQRPLERVGRR